MKLSLKTASWKPGSRSAVVRLFISRPAIDPAAESVARAILDEIRAAGDDAVLRYARKFDTPGLTAQTLRVSAAELKNASLHVDRDFRRQAKEADKRIHAFARAGRRKDWEMAMPHGGTLGERYVAMDRVGVYIPGGTAPLASTSLMTATLARAAGVREIVACTPADKQGKVNPYILHSLELAGATEIYKVGGAQAIGAMAYGTKSIPKVQKIVGPGNAYVAAAKKLVYGDVSLDSVAGPSEIAILADDSAKASHVAADLLSQAEHGTGLEKALLVTPDANLLKSMQVELRCQVDGLARRDLILPILEKGVLCVLVPDLDAGMELINRFAAEHLELLVRQPKKWCARVRAAGAVFLGPWSPESAGDFAAGPSHVLPTGGAAAMFSGLTVDDFMRRSSVLHLTRDDLRDVMPVIAAFSRVEGLDGHLRSAEVRFES
jgi:histidinol dehydrogenase